MLHRAVVTPGSSSRESRCNEAKDMVRKLKECTSSGDIKQGKALHLEAVNTGLISSFFVANTLISMYGRCGCMEDAEKVYEEMHRRDIVTWNCLIRGYVDHGKNELALQVYHRMQVAPDARTYVAVVTACANLAGKQADKGSSQDSNNRWLQKGRELHARAVASRCCDAYVQRSLLNMYTKFGSMIQARSVFDNMVDRDVISWTSLLQGYVQAGESELALQLFDRMDASRPGNCAPNSRTYAVALTAVSNLAAKTSDKSSWLEKGKGIHSRAATSVSCPFLDTVLINMYARCGSMTDAQKVFDEMTEQDVISWTALLQGYVENDNSLLALELFDRGSFVPDARTYVVALTACSRLAVGDVDKSRWLEKGSRIHSGALASSHCDKFVECVLIDMYGKCGDIVQARKVFDGMARRDVVSWNCLMRGYVEHGMSERTVELFDCMDCSPDSQTYVAALSACASLSSREDGDKERWLTRGKEIHAQALRAFCCNRYVENMLISMYSVSNKMLDARAVFDRMAEPDVVSWNTLLQGYVENEQTELALELFCELVNGCSSSIAPTEVTFVAGLGAYAKLMVSGKQDEDSFRDLLRKVKTVHSLAIEHQCCDSLVGTMLIDLYAKCRSVVDAKSAFDSMKVQDMKAWSCLIQGYVENGLEQVALKLVDSIPGSADSTVYATSLVACGNLSLVETGIAAHAEVERYGFLEDFWVTSCLMGFYSKCGDVQAVEQVFGQVPAKQTDAWNCLMGSYSQRGDTRRVVELFERMVEEGLSPNGVTFTHVLSACSRSGLTHKGRMVFEAMERYSVTPDVVHFGCVIDLLARGNEMDEAVKMVERMGVVDGVVWTSILAACSKSNNVVVGKIAYEALLRIDKRSGMAYNLMANLYQSREVITRA